MKQISKIMNEGSDKGAVQTKRGQEKGSSSNVNTPRPNVQPAPQKPAQGGKK